MTGDVTRFPGPEPPIEVAFSEIDRNPAELARDSIDPHNLYLLFDRLAAAKRRLADPAHGAHSAAVAALKTVVGFLRSNPLNKVEGFSVPLELLLAELISAGAPADARNILNPWERKQRPERNRRQRVNYLKGAAAYVTDRLRATGVKLEAASAQVADILKEHSFPMTPKQRANHPAQLAAAIEGWRENGPKGDDTVSGWFRCLPFYVFSPLGSETRLLETASAAELLVWFERELDNANFRGAADG